MMQFAEQFPDLQIVSPLVTQLSWTHFDILFECVGGLKALNYLRGTEF